MVTRR
ncbi:hypothetical protein YPPY72_3504, partial [Yersinia pestis PY-72]